MLTNNRTWTTALLRTGLVAGFCLTPWLDATAQGQGRGDKADEEKIKLAEMDPEFQGRVNEAIKRAIPWLLSQQKPDGSFPTNHDASQHGPFLNGGTAISLLALIKGGHPAISDEVEKGIKFLRESWKNFHAGGGQAAKHGWKVYEAGLTLMALEAKDMWRPLSIKSHKTVAQGKKLPQEDHEWVKQMKDWLEVNVARTRQEANNSKNGGGGLVDFKETWSYPSGVGFSDHSNTQYAVLGLHAAGKLGHPAKGETWGAVLEGFIFKQAATGPKVPRKVGFRPKKNDPYVRAPVTDSTKSDRARGWGYNGAAKPQAGTGQMAETGSMTTVGLACLEIAWYQLSMLARTDKDAKKIFQDRKLRGSKETAVDDGFAWLDKNWDITKNPNYDAWHYYYLYGMERAGVLSNRIFIGGHDWYREGGTLILDAQRGAMWDDGKGDGPVPSTCFAILFLTRATVPLVQTTR